MLILRVICPPKQVENVWKMQKNSGIYEEIVKQFNISLTWLDIKRVQCPINPEEKNKIADAISSKETKFVPGWLNDEVRTTGFTVKICVT